MVAHARIANEIGTIAATTGTNWVDPTYDAAGNMTKRAAPDDLGTDASAHLMTYDAWNRLVKITDNAPGTPATIATYEYDGLGRRIEKTVGSDTWDYYHSSSWQVLEVRKNGDTDPEEQFVYDGTYIDAPFMRYVDSNQDGDYDDADEGEHYFFRDASYNIVAYAGDDGTIKERYRYTPYGKRIAMSNAFVDKAGSDYGQQRGFQGLWHDDESGLIENRARMLDPGTGRFLQRDPLGYPDGMNAYAAYHSIRGGLDPSGTRLLMSGRSQRTIFEALKELCPCMEIRHRQVQRTQKTAIVGGGQTERQVTFTLIYAAPKKGWDEEEFCDCIDRHPGGCKVIHDLMAMENDVALVLDDNFENGVFRLREYANSDRVGTTVWFDNLRFLRWDSDYTGVDGPGNRAAPDGDEHFDKNPLTILGHELMHAWDFHHMGDVWRAIDGGIQNGVSDDELKWFEYRAVRFQNQILYELTGVHGVRDNYGGLGPVVDSEGNPNFNEPIFSEDDCSCVEWFAEFSERAI